MTVIGVGDLQLADGRRGMSGGSETLAEIVAEMRGMGNYQRYSGDHAHALADRIEAAAKRAEQTYLDQIRDAVNQWGHEKYKAEHAPIGNSAALREALEAVTRVGYPHNFQREAPHIRGYCYEITEAIKKCLSALAAPPRQCDVGTAEEQKERLKAFCMRHGCDKLGNPRCEDCKLLWDDRCELVWAQMPYEKGEADGSKEIEEETK